jgi:hypothetical protein
MTTLHKIHPSTTSVLRSSMAVFPKYRPAEHRGGLPD